MHVGREILVESVRVRYVCEKWTEYGVSSSMGGTARVEVAYKRPVKEASVEIEEELNAGHWVEPDREMQDEFWAMTVGRLAAASSSNMALVVRGREDGASLQERQDGMVVVGRVCHTAEMQAGRQVAVVGQNSIAPSQQTQDKQVSEGLWGGWHGAEAGTEWRACVDGDGQRNTERVTG